jgi:hypothetical protein
MRKTNTAGYDVMTPLLEEQVYSGFIKKAVGMTK